MKEILEYHWGYYDEDHAYRNQLNTLVQETFQIDLGIWNHITETSGQYTPYSYFHDNRIVANVSASPMKLVMDGSATLGVQVGTVVTAPSHRRQGLIRNLMERVHAYWDSNSDFMFLFADKSVWPFYEKFGYLPVQECAFESPTPGVNTTPKQQARKLDISNAADVQLLKHLSDSRSPVSQRLGVYDYTWLMLFHACVYFPKGLFYIDNLEIVAICRQSRSKLHLVDVIGDHVPSLDQLLPYLDRGTIQTVEFGFIPDRMQLDGINVEPSKDSHLLVRGSFPLKEAAFRFPLTSQA